MNIRAELAKAEAKHKAKNIFRKFLLVFKNLMCQHNELYSEIINVELGNCTSSLLEEIIGPEESKKLHQMKIRVTRCANCGREIYREFLEYDSSETKAEEASESNQPEQQ